MRSVEAPMDVIKETIRNVEYADKKINIGTLAKPNEIDDFISNARKVCPWIPEDIKTCPSHEILASEEAKDFCKKHMRKGTYKIEMFRDPNCDCSFCTMPKKSDVVCKGHIPYPVLGDDGHYLIPNECLPVGSPLVELGCPSKNGHNRVGRHYPNQNRINNSTLLGHIECVACGKPRCLWGSRKNVPPEFIEWIINVYAKDYEYQCGNTLYPNNSSKHVIFPDDDWYDDRCLIEVRHKLFCSTPLEVQVSVAITFAINTNPF